MTKFLDPQMQKTVDMIRKNAAEEIKSLITRNYFWNDKDYDELMKEIDRRFKI